MADSVEQTLPPCPSCQEDMTYEMGELPVCPMCSHEWNPEQDAADAAAAAEASALRDSVGNIINEGDTVSIAHDVKLKGGSTIKVGTRVPDIRILEFPVDGHDLQGRVPGVGVTYLKSSIVKKV